MKTIFTRYFLSVAVIVSLMAVVNTSCQKETESNATIIVVNSMGGAPVVGATVVLDCNTCQPVGTLQTATEITDGSGRATFTFQLEAVLDVTVTHPTGTPTATSVVKLEAGKSVEKTVPL
jgi:uncharacterized membrane protein